MSTATIVRNESFCLPLKVEQEKNQGIVSILGSDSRGTKPPLAASFRRTLSADMSSKKWLAQNGFSKPPTMKKISSFAQLSFISAIDHHSSSSSDEEEEQVYGKKTNQNPKQVDVWSSILSQKKSDDLPPPYVHPLLKKSSSSLCSKSLEICTESLGSETGSDKITLSLPLETGSEANDSSKVKELSKPQTEHEMEYPQNSFSEEPPAVAKYNYFAASNKKLQPKTFPPPIPLLAGSSEGPSLHMHSHRENGRLVLEAVSVPSTKNFHAHRRDGRLRLTLIKTITDQQHVQQPHRDEAVIFDQKGFNIEDNLEEVFDIFEKEEENDIQEDDRDVIEEELNETPEIVMKQAVAGMARGMLNVHRSAVMMKKIMGLENQNPTWSHKFNHAAAKLDTKDNNEKETATLSFSLPPRPRTTRPIPTTPAPAAASFNAYEYFWRTMPMTTSLKNPLTHCSALKNNTGNKFVNSDKPNTYEQQELLVLRNCRKARRSLLRWDAYCIATT